MSEDKDKKIAELEEEVKQACDLVIRIEMMLKMALKEIKNPGSTRKRAHSLIGKMEKILKEEER